MIKVSGYRLGTAEIESGLGEPSGSVAEAAAIGVPDEVRGNVIYAYCILRAGFQRSDELVDKLKDHIRHEVGPIAVPTKIEFVSDFAQDAFRQDYAPRPQSAGDGFACRRPVHPRRLTVDVIKSTLGVGLYPRVLFLNEVRYI